MLPWFRRGSAGWVLLAAGIFAWNVTAADEQMLSEAFRRCKRDPVACAVVVTVWSVLTAHLFGVLPPRADPLHAVFVLRDARRRGGPALKRKEVAGKL